MANRERPVDRATLASKRATLELGRELRLARIDRNLSQSIVAHATGISQATVSRIERGRHGGVTLANLFRLFAAVGMELKVRAYPLGEPIRDAAHLDLLRRFRSRLHPTLRWATEVPLPIIGDRRAWDGLVRGSDWIVGVEAETRVSDIQALDRRVALKTRDGGVDAVVLLLADTRHHRRVLREFRDALASRYTVPGRSALQRLASGADPGGNAIVLV